MSHPFIAEKLAFMLGHDVYARVTNVIDRAIFFPKLDLANGKRIDPTRDTNVTTAAIPGASVFVAAGTLMNQQGSPFTGVLSVTEVPVNLTPAALPENLRPDLVVTIQPGEMVFATPAPMSFPNRSGWAPGTRMDLWSINPVTGQFEDFGNMQVSADGATVDTISGGVRNRSWHFFAPPPPGNFVYSIPGQHYWIVSADVEDTKVALQRDLRDAPSGRYSAGISQTLFRLGQYISGESELKVLHVNTINSQFGSGWGFYAFTALNQLASVTDRNTNVISFKA